MRSKAQDHLIRALAQERATEGRPKHIFFNMYIYTCSVLAPSIVPHRTGNSVTRDGLGVPLSPSALVGVVAAGRCAQAPG